MLVKLKKEGETERESGGRGPSKKNPKKSSVRANQGSMSIREKQNQKPLSREKKT